MSIITFIKGVINKMLRKEIKERFDADIKVSAEMEKWISEFYNITSGNPWWANEKENIDSINFAGFIADVTAGLVTLDLDIKFPETQRGDYLKTKANYVLAVIQDKVSEGLGNCGIIFKPNGINVDYIEPMNFAPTDVDSNGDIWGCVFRSIVERGDYTYTKLEWQRFDNKEKGIYHITNYAYKVKSKELTSSYIGDRIELKEVPEWADLADDIALQNVKSPLFAYFKNPAPNRLDRNSALGVPIWVNAMKELRDLDIAWSRKSDEVEDSQHITFVPESAVMFANNRKATLPRYVKGLELGIDGTGIQEHTSTLLTADRIADINSILAMISSKCGFSQGFFALDAKTGVRTATEVESDQQETIRTIKNIRDALRVAMENLLYALNIMADLYSGIPAEKWESLKENIVFSFGDILYNYEADKLTWWNYVQSGKMPAWKYFVKFENMTEEEAKALIEEAQPKELVGGLFE